MHEVIDRREKNICYLAWKMWTCI